MSTASQVNKEQLETLLRYAEGSGCPPEILEGIRVNLIGSTPDGPNHPQNNAESTQGSRDTASPSEAYNTARIGGLWARGASPQEILRRVKQLLTETVREAMLNADPGYNGASPEKRAAIMQDRVAFAEYFLSPLHRAGFNIGKDLTRTYFRTFRRYLRIYAGQSAPLSSKEMKQIAVPQFQRALDAYGPYITQPQRNATIQQIVRQVERQRSIAGGEFLPVNQELLRNAFNNRIFQARRNAQTNQKAMVQPKAQPNKDRQTYDALLEEQCEPLLQELLAGVRPDV